MKSKKTGATITLNAQYIKDLSFENPNSPEIYTYKDMKPKIAVSIDLNAKKLQQETFESEMVINIEAKNEDKTIFVIELVYAGIFTIKNVSDDLIQENLFIDCPTMIYPFARTIIANTIVSANFPPVMMDMIDFEEMYNSKKDSIKQKNDK